MMTISPNEVHLEITGNYNTFKTLHMGFSVASPNFSLYNSDISCTLFLLLKLSESFLVYNKH